MPKLSIISHFYNHPDLVESQIAYWDSLPDSILSQTEFILVDDCSEELPVIKATRLNLKVFRIITDIPWNQAGARNLGAFNATGEWALFFDIDQKFYAEPMANLIASLHLLNPQTLYYFRIKELTNTLTGVSLLTAPSTFLANLAKFKWWGMYDEDFAGHYGYEDLYVPQVWEKHGGDRILFSEPVYFEDLPGGTMNLDRDTAHNKALAQQKMATGTKNSPGILRFEWDPVDISVG